MRAGYSDGGGAIVDRSISSGIGYKINERNDYLGFGVGWARAASDDKEIKKRDQYTIESYYRLQLFSRLQLVPSIQYIHNPAFDIDRDTVWIGSMRVRAVF